MLVLKVGEIVNSINVVPNPVVWEWYLLELGFQNWVDLFG